jgi:hypothetical protein
MEDIHKKKQKSHKKSKLHFARAYCKICDTVEGRGGGRGESTVQYNWITNSLFTDPNFILLSLIHSTKKILIFPAQVISYFSYFLKIVFNFTSLKTCTTKRTASPDQRFFEVMSVKSPWLGHATQDMEILNSSVNFS